jgi:hypothetical protein
MIRIKWFTGEWDYIKISDVGRLRHLILEVRGVAKPRRLRLKEAI